MADSATINHFLYMKIRLKPQERVYGKITMKMKSAEIRNLIEPVNQDFLTRQSKKDVTCLEVLFLH